MGLSANQYADSSEKQVAPPFYASCTFWTLSIMMGAGAFWGYLALTNPGCPEYTIIETLKFE